MDFFAKKRNDYYPGGMLLPNRHGSSDSYRYGYNGMETDDEFKGRGNSYDYGARMYDPRVGRFLTLDPQSFNFPFESNYAFVSGNPIIYKDPNGEAKILTINILNSKGEMIGTFSVVIDEDYIESKVSKWGPNGPYFNDVEEYSWHDVNVIQDVIIADDGSFSLGNTTTELMDKTVTTTSHNSSWLAELKVDWEDLTGAKKGQIWDGGGIDFYSKVGRGSGVRAKDKSNVDMVNGDELMALLKLGKVFSKGQKGGFKTGNPGIDGIFPESDLLSKVKKFKKAYGEFKQYKKHLGQLIEPIFEANNYPIPCSDCSRLYSRLTLEEIDKESLTRLEIREAYDQDERTNVREHERAAHQRTREKK